MQIERILHSQGFGSRKRCRELVEAGRVTVAGVAAHDPHAEFPTEGLAFAVDGEPWQFHERAYLMLHKPAGYECSRQPQHHPSVFALLPDVLANRGVQCVGRLDQDTTGLLLLSDDGQFVHRWSSGKKRTPKVYEVAVRHPVDDIAIAALLAGVELRDEPQPIAAAGCIATGERSLRLTVTEGKYHQVKRMIAAVGNRVEALHRSRVGALELPPDLAAGEWRWLDADALDRLGRDTAA